jgi:flagellar hook-basal body complex protein FliE
MSTEIKRVGSPQAIAPEAGAGKTVEQFKEMLYDAIDNVSDLQRNADELMTKLATGEAEDLHQVMIAVEKVNLALQLTLQIRNKMLEAYQEIMRMQV